MTFQLKSNYTWKGNKNILFMSTLAVQTPMEQIVRYDRKTKRKSAVHFSYVVKEYSENILNMVMLDSIISRFKIH